MNENRYLTVEQAAAYLQVSKWSLYKLVERRDIPFIPFGRLLRFDRMAIDRWVEKRSVQAGPRRRERAAIEGNQTPVSIVPMDGLAESANG